MGFASFWGLMWSVLHPFGLQTSTPANIRPDVSVCAFKDKTHGKWVFEKDIFDSNVHSRGRNDDEISLYEAMDEETGLIPNEWISLQVGLHKTRAERRKELQLQQLEETKRKSLELRQKKEQLETKFVSYNASDEYIPSVNIPKMPQESTGGKEKSVPLQEKRRVYHNYCYSYYTRALSKVQLYECCIKSSLDNLISVERIGLSSVQR